MMQILVTTGWMITVLSFAGDVGRHIAHFSCNCALTQLLTEGFVFLNLTRYKERKSREKKGKNQKQNKKTTMGSLYLLLCLHNAECTKIK